MRVRPARGASERLLVATHRCLPVGGLFGKGLRQVATLGPPWAALVGWQAAALKLTAPDRWIGRSPARKPRRPRLVLQNSGLVSLPRARVPQWASHLLARRLPADWMRRYRSRPALLETFSPRFQGACYRTANWIDLGQTPGRGKLDTRRQYSRPVKNFFVKPPFPYWKALLNR